MTSLPECTRQRLQRLPLIPHVWEGGRLPVEDLMASTPLSSGQKSDCIIWLDGSEGLVRAMDIVKASAGKEAVVRVLLKAIENPHNPAKPGRPKKIVVKDRELQFFLRGVLQNLDIEVDYRPQLPLLDELWFNFQSNELQNASRPSPHLLSKLGNLACCLWQLQPWLLLSEDEILRVDINRWHIDSLYVCVLGMMGEERGIVLYRSLDSLKQFREAIAYLALTRYSSSQDEEELESIFLKQDCWFVNFNCSPPFSSYPSSSTVWKSECQGEKVSIVFGSIHPYEGIRALKDDEEIFPIYAALSALASFIEQHEDDLAGESIRLVQAEYVIPSPDKNDASCQVSVSTMPDLTCELEGFVERIQEEVDSKIVQAYSAPEDGGGEEDLSSARGEGLSSSGKGKGTVLKYDLLPYDTIVLLDTIPSLLLSRLHNVSYAETSYCCPLSAETVARLHNQAATTPFPVVILQTTKPKAKELLSRLEAERGIARVMFAPSKYPNEVIGILQTTKGDFYVLEWFPKQANFLQRWRKRVAKFDGYCGVVVAMGARGSSRGNPQAKDLLYLFYTRVDK